MMEPVTDTQILYAIQRQVPMLSPDPNIQWKLFRAWAVPSNYEDGYGEWYHVELTNNYQVCVKGIVDVRRGTFYLDAMGMLSLVEERITAQLDAFNAGHHWRYKGL